MAEFIFEKYKAEKEFVKLLNEYYRERQFYEEAVRNYNKAKENYRHFSREENQLRKAMERLKKSYGYEASSDKEWSTYYNKHFIPITTVDKKELRKTYAEDCKRAKELVKLHQHFFNKAFLELKYFATYRL
jgi:hypothetical protein